MSKGNKTKNNYRAHVIIIPTIFNDDIPTENYFYSNA